MDDQDEKPIGETFGRLIEDGKAYVRAEVNLVRTRLDIEVDRFRPVAILGAAGLLFAFAALVALAVTLVLTLASLIGPLGGGLAATAIFAAIAGLLAYLAKRSLDRSRA
ncbi:hypothetical protein G7076_06305 [Sphingomonas sp. HDW15A]|uniref:phage holin family protein n=1 Tax=Sphingomonas sp. HDW15A TaxID=2714942 RepID=UPI0014090E81|nr:phage holin family protein [Sphingomonas sp. HDW15A]QIK96110.1 hypothetical protein G7076_06305 [Sphingomonas sp. HDW15A]